MQEHGTHSKQPRYRSSEGTRHRERGIIALAVVIGLAIFLFSVSTLMLIQSGTSISLGKFQNQADRAQTLAEAGVQDALARISRDSTYAGTVTLSQSDDETIETSVTANSSTTSTIVTTATVLQGGDRVKRTIRALVTYTTSGDITAITRVNQ